MCAESEMCDVIIMIMVDISDSTYNQWILLRNQALFVTIMSASTILQLQSRYAEIILNQINECMVDFLRDCSL